MVDNKQYRYISPGIPYFRMWIGDEGKPLDIIPNYLHSMHLKDLGAGSGILSLTLFDPEWDFLEELIVPYNKTIRYQFGWSLGEKKQISGIKKGGVIGYMPVFNYQGNMLTIRIQGNEELRDSHVFNRAWPPAKKASIPGGGTIGGDVKEIRISDIVKFIAAEMKLDATLETDIEETEIIKQSVLQDNKTNFNFIKNKLVPLAVSAKTKRTDYIFNIYDNRMVFRTVNYDNQLARRYHFARDQEGQMLQFSPHVRAKAIIGGQVDKQKAVSWDPINKSLITFTAGYESEKDKRVKLGKRIPKPPDLKKGAAGRVYICPYEVSGLTESFIRSRFTEKARLSVTAEATVVGDPTLARFDVVDVVVRKNDGRVHYTSGNYFIINLHHIMDAGTFVTKLDLVRDAVMSGEAPNKGIEKKLTTVREDDKGKKKVKSKLG